MNVVYRVILKHLFGLSLVQYRKLVCFEGKYWATAKHRPISVYYNGFELCTHHSIKLLFWLAHNVPNLCQYGMKYIIIIFTPNKSSYFVRSKYYSSHLLIENVLIKLQEQEL